jgi:hypothetical protein
MASKEPAFAVTCGTAVKSMRVRSTGCVCWSYAVVAELAGIPSMIVVNPGLPIKTIEQFVACARANPGKINYGYGNSSGQIGGETLQRELGIRLVAVPCKGIPQAAQDVMAGHIGAMVVDVATAQPLVKVGRLRVGHADRKTHEPAVRGAHRERDRRARLRRHGLVRGFRPPRARRLRSSRCSRAK